MDPKEMGARWVAFLQMLQKVLKINLIFSRKKIVDK